MQSRFGAIAFSSGALVLAIAVFVVVARVSGSRRLHTDARKVMLTLLSAGGALLLLVAAYGIVVITRSFRT